MSALTEFLHKLVDRAGVSELHSEIDALDTSAEPGFKGEAMPVETDPNKVAAARDSQPETGEEETSNA